MLRTFTAVLLAVSPAHAYAQGVCTEALPVTTPCEGLLLPHAEASRAAKCLHTRLPEAAAQLGECVAEGEVRAASCQKQLDSYSDFNTRLSGLLDKALEIPETSWWESGGFIYGAGVVTGMAVVLGGAWTLSKLN